MKGLPSAAAFLVVRSTHNRIRRQLLRLREPRYLVGALAGALYFYSLLSRGRHRMLTLPPSATPLVEALLLGLGLAAVTGAWFLGKDEPSLKFTEPEIQMFFPGPVSRRGLLQYKLWRSHLRTGVGAVVSTFIFGRALTPSPWLFAAGTWVAMSTLSMHVTAASLTRKSLLEHGRAGLKGRALSLLVLGAVLGLLAYGVWRAPLPPQDSTDALATWGPWVSSVLNTPPLSWGLWPLRALTRLMLAPSPRDFVTALPAAALLFTAHFAWVLSSRVSFEDEAIAYAQRRSQWLQARRAGRPALTSSKGLSAPLFKLPARGHPAVALLWKNLALAGRGSLRRLLAACFGMGAAFTLIALTLTPRTLSGYFGAAAGVCLGLFVYLTVLGPTLLPVDLRHDLPQMDLLRSFPLPGWQVVLAELLAPWVVLAVLQWALLGAALMLSSRYPFTFSLALRLCLAMALSAVAPALTLGALAIQNAAVLLFPGWSLATSQAPRGIEVLGQRLVTVAATLLVLALGLLPGALAGAPWLLTWRWLGPFCLPIASVFTAGVLLTEVYVVTRVLGRVFDRFDLTR